MQLISKDLLERKIKLGEEEFCWLTNVVPPCQATSSKQSAFPTSGTDPSTAGLHSPLAWPSQHLITLDTVFYSGRQLGPVVGAVDLGWEAPGTLGQVLQPS